MPFLTFNQTKMKYITLIAMALLAITKTYAQNSFNAYIKNKDKKQPIEGAILAIGTTGFANTSDANGFVSIPYSQIPYGIQVIHCQFIGYTPRVDSIAFPIKDTLVFYLEAVNEELDAVEVTTTRSSRTIEAIPTRVEVINGEELAEKANMKPGDIKMILSESTGIQTLQTSPISGNTGIRIEGMDGRYTQILKDGFPLYAGFSGGLGLLQTPPLDLKQVEIIKGSSSTLYGGGAIAGLINLISKTPKDIRELRFVINGTSAKGLDVNGYYGKRFNKVGLTLYAAINRNEAFAPDNTQFTAIPKYNRYTFNPKLFFYFSERTYLKIGVNATFENRLGGDIAYINGEHDSLHSYFEDNKTERISSELELKHTFENQGVFIFKNSSDHFNRIINLPNYIFDGTQNSTFSELSYFRKFKKSEWTTGANFITDEFREKKLTNIPLRDNSNSTFGVFAQNIWDLSKRVVLETGVRGDYIVGYPMVFLPRVSILYKTDLGLSSRLGGGLGYKAPTIFTEESERINYKNVLPLTSGKNILERSYGANWDINYKTFFTDSKVSFSANQLFFYTLLNSPLVLSYMGNGTYGFENLNAHVDAMGAETNVKIGYGAFKLFLGYTYTHSHIHLDGQYKETPLTPRHHTNSVLMYEVENKWKVGAEAYYFSPQKLNDGSTGRDYWLLGFMAERMWQKCSLFINFENMLDTRQTRFGSIYTGSINNPEFKDIYAPLDGFVFNGGVKIKI